MKTIKNLLPLWLILLYFGSIAYMLQSRTDKNDQYRQLVKAAREYAENDVLVDAVSSYEAALEIHPNVELMVEAGELYLSGERYQEAGNWYKNQLHFSYPNQKETYEFGIRTYLAQNDYSQAYTVYDEYKKRELKSDEIETMMLPIQNIFEISGQYEDARPFGNISKIAAVKYNDYWGYVNTDGDRVLDYEYISAGTFGDMTAVVNMDGEAYFADGNGNKKITEKTILDKDPDLGRVERFLGIEGGVLWAYNGSYWNCYDAETYEKLFGGYAAVTNISNGIGAVENETAKWALIGPDGKERTEYLYDGVLTDEKDIFCRTDSVLVKEGNQYLLLDKEGNQVGDSGYEGACAFYDTTYAAVKIDGKWTFIDQKGTIQDLGIYDQAKSFSAGKAAVCKDGKWGYIDLEGNLVIDYQFDVAGPFCTQGVSFVKEEDEKYWSILSLYKYNH